MTTNTPLPNLPPQPIRRITVQQFIDMHRHEVFTEDDRLELLDGWIVEKPHKTPLHVRCSTHLVRLLFDLIPAERWAVFAEAAILLSSSVPEPSFTIARGGLDDYADRLATGGDVALIIEISHTDLAAVRDYKLRLYAGAGIPTCWLINLVDRQIEVFTEPDTAVLTYSTMQVFRSGDSLPISLDDEDLSLTSISDQLW